MRVFEDEDFQFGFELVLGATYHQSADVGEARHHRRAHPRRRRRCVDP